MSWFNDWYEEEHWNDYRKPSKVKVFSSKKSSRIRRREFIKNRINEDL